MKNNKKITIIGSGALGTAIANYFFDAGNNVCIFGIDKKEIDDINNNHKNSKYFSNVELPKIITATLDIKLALKDSFIIALAIPSVVINSVLKEINDNLYHPVYFINLSKGFNFDKKSFIYEEIGKQILPKFNLGILKLSGPSFASQLITREPTSFVLACKDLGIAKKIKQYLLTEYISIEISQEIKGVELLSIIKNIYAILMGIIDGLGYKENTKAWFFTEITKEINQILDFFSVDRQIFFSPAGIGDLFLTCSYKISKNYQIGQKIGEKNYRLKEIEEEFKTIEGIWNIQFFYNNLKNNKYKFKLLNLLYNNLYSKLKTRNLILNYLQNNK